MGGGGVAEVLLGEKRSADILGVYSQVGKPQAGAFLLDILCIWIHGQGLYLVSWNCIYTLFMYYYIASGAYIAFLALKDTSRRLQF